MLHLSSERLAELADSEPTIAEAEHLAACATCATERSAHQRLRTMASDERDRTAQPLTEWSLLAARLRDEGIISAPVSLPATAETKVVPLPTRPHGKAWLAGLRVAAGIVFALGFGALGRVSANASAAPSRDELVALGNRVVRGGKEVIPPPVRNVIDQSGGFSDVSEALATLESAQRNYDRAVQYIAAHDSTVQSPEASDVYRTRLAALDQMAEVSRQGLSVAPTDPVLNQYYLSTLGAREVTLRQLGSVLTPGKRMARF
jgi:hypothetical protein